MDALPCPTHHTSVQPIHHSKWQTYAFLFFIKFSFFVAFFDVGCRRCRNRTTSVEENKFSSFSVLFERNESQQCGWWRQHKKPHQKYFAYFYWIFKVLWMWEQATIEFWLSWRWKKEKKEKRKTYIKNIYWLSQNRCLNLAKRVMDIKGGLRNRYLLTWNFQTFCKKKNEK